MFEQRAAADTFYVLLAGRLKVVQSTPDGQQVVVRFVGPDEPAGALAAFGIPAYPATAIAVADTVALGWAGKQAAALMQRFPSWAMATSAAIGGRIQDAHTRLREMATERVERRIAHAVLRLARQAGRGVDAGVQIEFPLGSKEVWGHLFGTIDTREEFVDLRRTLAEHEWARFKKNNSLECRNCHSAESMDITKQSQRAAQTHERFLFTGEKTCIDCHKGIAHRLPDMTGVPGWQ